MGIWGWNFSRKISPELLETLLLLDLCLSYWTYVWIGIFLTLNVNRNTSHAHMIWGQFLYEIQFPILQTASWPEKTRSKKWNLEKVRKKSGIPWDECDNFSLIWWFKSLFDHFRDLMQLRGKRISLKLPATDVQLQTRYSLYEIFYYQKPVGTFIRFSNSDP